MKINGSEPKGYMKEFLDTLQQEPEAAVLSQYDLEVADTHDGQYLLVHGGMTNRTEMDKDTLKDVIVRVEAFHPNGGSVFVRYWWPWSFGDGCHPEEMDEQADTIKGILRPVYLAAEKACQPTGYHMEMKEAPTFVYGEEHEYKYG